MQFTDDEIETIKSLICEWGSDCPSTDSDKVKELEYKLGLSVRPTPEEIAEREARYAALRNSPFNKQMSELFAASNKHMIESMAENIMVRRFWDSEQWGDKIGSNLKIRLPNDYLKENKND